MIPDRWRIGPARASATHPTYLVHRHLPGTSTAGFGPAVNSSPPLDREHRWAPDIQAPTPEAHPWPTQRANPPHSLVTGTARLLLRGRSSTEGAADRGLPRQRFTIPLKRCTRSSRAPLAAHRRPPRWHANPPRHHALALSTA